MKLSDIGDLQKLAAEFKQYEQLLHFIRRARVDTISIKVHGYTSNNAESGFTVGDRNTIPAAEVAEAIAAALKAKQDVLRTKLTMCGVDDFEEP